MPELPDLVHIQKVLGAELAGDTVAAVSVREPIVLRVAVPEGFAAALGGRTLTAVSRRGPFLVLDFAPLELIVHFMLAGRFRLAGTRSPAEPGGAGRAPRGRLRDAGGPPAPRPGRTASGLCFSLSFASGRTLEYLDDKRMGKVYLVRAGDTVGIPGFGTQGLDVLSGDFTLEAFRRLATGRRQQVRVFLMDQTALSAIGNAYADEILFAARLHPKTGCHQLGPEEVERLYRAVGEVLAWGAAEVEAAGEPLEVKVRGHMKVRGRHGEPCPVCGTPIRRAGVLGYDAFFCPRCQATPQIRRPGVPW
jgi:formamidopyrimidine-DNA glycosylase